MSHNILFSFLLVTLVQAQLNGEFWWLNGKLNKLKKVQPTPPKIDVRDFQNEENSKIIFRDDDLFTNKLKPISDRTSKLMPNNNLDENKVVWPTEEHMKNKNVDVEVFTTQKVIEKEKVTKPIKIQNKYEDLLVFSYPKNDKFVAIDAGKANTESTPISTQSAILFESSSVKVNAFTNKLSSLSTTKDEESQNICTYTTKKKCYEFNGFVYEYSRRIPATSGDVPLICCILPIQPILNKNNLSHTIHFPQTSILNRNKRSDTETNTALKQRDFLLKHKFTTQRQNVKPASTPFTKIVTSPEDEYVDPYLNIKNTKFQTPKKLGNTKYDDCFEKSQEYTDELPKPGLIGLYSDHAQSPPIRPFANGNQGFGYGGSYDDYEEDDEDGSFGYSTIDPRRATRKQGFIVKPQKITTTSDELAFDAEKHTINFQSDPDFHVFQGFKLLNLFRNTSRVHTKNILSNRDSDVLLSAPDKSEENAEIFDKSQLFDGCGKIITRKVVEGGIQIGEAARGSHPWLALVVLTKSQHNLLCYATLIHPRAAITIADCTQGTAPGDVTVISGLWDLNDRYRSKNRVATVHVHPRYKPGEVENNLAILYWMRPLKLSANVQPACLGHPQIGDDCKLFGWGGLDQGIQQTRSRWQRATVRACSGNLGINKHKRLLGDAYCVSASRGAVTGIGGPLICEVKGHSFVVGVVVSRDNGYVLSPVRDWAMNMDNL